MKTCNDCIFRESMIDMSATRDRCLMIEDFRDSCEICEGVERGVLECLHHTTVSEARSNVYKAYDKGYKQGVRDYAAREIFAEIEKWLAKDGDIRLITAEKLAELKKKYTEEGK